jgi:tetratricopeptide (TPR) repeat protein
VAAAALCAQDPPPTGISGLPLTAESKTRIESALKERRYTEAEALLVQEAERKPESRPLLTFLGRVFFLDNKFLNCATALSKAERIAPLIAADRFTLAMAFIGMKHPDWARAELEKLRQSDAKNALYLYWLGKLDFDDQNLPAAVQKFEQAIQLDPGLVKAHDMLGVSREMAGKYDEAGRHFEDAIRLNRKSPAPSAWPPLDYGSMLLKTGEPAGAEAYLREAVRYDPKLAKARYRLGSALQKLGRADEAIAELNQAAALDPADPEPWYALARIYRQQNRSKEADQAIEEFQKRSRNGKSP